MTVPMMPIVGEKPPAFSNGAAPARCRAHHAVDLGLKNHADQLGVGAVDHQLETLAGEVVFDRR